MRQLFTFIFIFLSTLTGLAEEIFMRTDFTSKPKPGGEFDLIRWTRYGSTQVTNDGIITEPSQKTGWSQFSTSTGLDSLPSPDQGTLIVSWSFIPDSADKKTGPKGLVSQVTFGNAFVVDLSSGHQPRLNEKTLAPGNIPFGRSCQMDVELNSRHILSWKVNGKEQLKEPHPLHKGNVIGHLTFRDFSAHNIRTTWLKCSIVRGDRRENVPLKEKWDFVAEPSPDQPAGFIVTSASSMTKIFREAAAFSGKFTTEVNISAAGRERESFQAVIFPLGAQLKNFEIQITDLERDGGGAKFSAHNIHWNPIGYVRSKSSSSSLCRANWEWPDILLPREELKITPGFVQPIWFTVNVPANFPAGTYRGIITFSADNVAKRILRLRLDVRPFSLPLRGKFKTAFGLNPGVLELWYFPKETRKLMDMQQKVNLYLLHSAQPTRKLISREKWRAIYDMLLEHRVNPLNLYSPPVNGVTRPVPDLEDFQYCFDRGLNAVCLGGVEWLDTDQKKYFANYAEYLKTWESIAQSSQGKQIEWFIHCFDESSCCGEEIQKRKDREFAAVKSFLSNQFPWIQLESTNPYMAKHEKNIDIWVPHNTHLADSPEIYSRLVKQHPGKVWGYVSNVSLRPLSSFFMDYPGTDPRVLPWQFFQQGLSGFLYWNILDIKCQPNWEFGPRWPSVPWQPVGSGCNGEGVLIYPWHNQTLLPSIRLENLRDGIEDYEALNMLQEAIIQLEKKGNNVTDIKKEFNALQEQVAGSHFKNGTESPETIGSARTRVDQLIEQLGKNGLPQ